MKPGFFSLFKRGRYLRLLDDGRDQREQERFTAATIGFCIDQDRQFAIAFWTAICKGPNDPPAGRISCQVEPEHWADLVVFNQTTKGKWTCVVELKLDKSLADHQNPAKAAFAAESGYGRKVVEDRVVIESRHRRYVILGAVPTPDFPDKHAALRLRLANRQWDCLAQSLPNTQMCQEFSRLLQTFGVAAFRYRLTKNMKMTSSLREAAQAHALLQDTAAKLGFHINPKSWDIRATDPSDPEYWCYGVGVETKTAGRQKDAFTSLLGERVGFEHLAWMGYEAAGKHGLQLVVELYPSSSAVRGVQKLLLRTAQAGGWQIDAAPEGEPRTISICTRPPTESDSEWFQSVFRAVGIGK